MSEAPGFMLVGEAPNAATVGRPRLSLLPDSSGIPHAANRLLEYSGLSRPDYLRAFPFRTDVWPDLRKKRIGEGRELAGAIILTAAELGPLCLGIVALGSWASRAFGIRGEPFTWGTIAERGVVGRPALIRGTRLPHPCDRTGWWHDPLNAARARAFFRDLLTEAHDAGGVPADPDPATS